MNSQIFWNVIANYNKHTITIQIILMFFLGLSLLLSYYGKIKWIAKLALGIANIYISIVFFCIYGIEPVQKLFALPLYFICGAIFLYECIRNTDDKLHRPNPWQILLLLLYAIYPGISILLGNYYPKMVTYIMPCPIISLSIAVYSGYSRKNKFLLFLLTIWGLTGIKSVIFNVYEDIILLICGVYGVVVITREIRKTKLK